MRGNGVMEYRGDGVLGRTGTLSLSLLLRPPHHHSITRSFPYTASPPVYHSTTPPPHSS